LHLDLCCAQDENKKRRDDIVVGLSYRDSRLFEIDCRAPITSGLVLAVMVRQAHHERF
jgi:hypothetical protein